MKQKKYLEIIGGSKADAEKKFPWLKTAKFENAVMDIGGYYLIWKNGYWKVGYWENGIWEDGYWENGYWKSGTWENGTWKNGIWEDGYWKNGIWEDGYWKNGYWKSGTWKNGIWEDGRMWSELKQTYLSVMFDTEKKEFKEVR